MAIGRPRTVSPPDEELEKLGQQMLDFVSDKKNNVLHLSEWWSTEMFFIERVWDTICRREAFVPYYERALRIIGKKYIDKDSKVRDGISQRWQRVYFKDLKHSEDKDSEADYERKAKALKGEARAAEEEKQKVIDEVQRNRKPIS